MYSGASDNTINLGSQKDAVGGFVQSEFRRYKDARSTKEEIWLQCWAKYLGTPQAMEYIRSQAANVVGNVSTDWRHKVNNGKAYENVETVVSYIQSAFFPNMDWFDLTPQGPTDPTQVKVLKKYLMTKLNQFAFKSHAETFIRQACITGNSVMALPWRAETVKWKKKVQVEDKNPTEVLEENAKPKWKTITVDKIVKQGTEFETLNMFDCFVEPTAAQPNEAGFIRRIPKTKADIIALIKSGFYKQGNIKDVAGYGHNPDVVSDSERKARVSDFQGVQYDPKFRCDVLEYWGDIYLDDNVYRNKVVTVLGDKVLRYEDNTYWAGKPFVVASCIPVPFSPYGLGIIEPSLGLLHELNLITNQRLDNLELSTDSMWTLLADGVLKEEDVYTKPGKVFLVQQHGDLQPIQGNNNFQVSYQEASLLEQRIDKTIGTGPFIGVGPGRGGDRVTAQEITAQRDAGGNRLSGVQQQLENNWLLPTLTKFYRNCQQFIEDDEIIEVATDTAGTYAYVTVGLEELQNDYKIQPTGAQHIADRDNERQQRIDFVTMAVGVPQFAELLDYKAILEDIAPRFGFDDLDRFLKDKEEAAAAPPGMPPGDPMTQPPVDPMAQDMAAMAEIGGQPLANAVGQELQVDGGMGLSARVLENAGVAPNASQIVEQGMMPQI